VGGTKGLDAMNTPSGTFVAVVVPADKPPFNDNRVREALKLTVDRDVMLAGAFEGYGETGQDHPISSAYQYYSAVEPRKRNVERAKALLKEAGHANGLSFTLFVAVSPPLREKLAVILKEMARPAGFDVKIEVVSYDRYLSQVWNKGLPYVVYYSTRPTPDLILKKLYHPTEGLDEGRLASQNPEFVKLIEKAGVSVDPAERQKLYSEIYKISRDQGTFLIPFFKSELSAKANYVKDYLARPVSYEVEIENVWLTADAPKKKA
jgi:peptide/nickel transport system substrate-binding protein